MVNRAANSPPPQLPSGRARHGLSPEEVAATQRSRLLDGLIEAVAHKGYAALTVADVAAAARVSRRTFYEHFRDKEDCFMAAIDTGATEVLGEMASAASAAVEACDWVDAVRESAAAYLRALARRPDFARAFHVEILGSGSHGLEFRAEVHRRFAEMYQALYSYARERDASMPEVPAATFRLATGAFDEYLLEWIRQGRIAELEQLAPLAGFLAQAFLHGVPEAAVELRGPSASFTVDTLPAGRSADAAPG